MEDHILTMFGPGCEPPPWDAEKKYKAEDLEVSAVERQLIGPWEISI